MKKCERCEGKGRYTKVSSYDNLFSELDYCRECQGTGETKEED